MEANVYIIIQKSLQRAQFLKKLVLPGFSWEIFNQVTRLDQSCASENI